MNTPLPSNRFRPPAPVAPQPKPSGSTFRRRWWLTLGIGLVFSLGAILGWRQIASPDIGFHLSSARWILEHGSFPRTDPFSFTFPDHPYYDLQWLFQVVLYGAHQLGGTTLILLMKLALTFTFWGLLLVRSLRREGRLPLGAVLLLLCVVLADFYEERPQLFSWLWGSLVFLVLEEYSRGNRRWLTALPAIMLLWVNSHSLFVLGLVTIGVYGLWELRKGPASDKRLLIAALAAGLVCAANPYFLQALLLPLKQFGEIQHGNPFKSPISGTWEFQSPFSFSYYLVDGRFVLLRPALFWHSYCLLAALGLIGSWRRVRVPELALGALFFYIFWSANKNFGYFAMATFPLAAGGLAAVEAKIRQWLEGNKKKGLRTAAGFVWSRLRSSGTPALAAGFIALAVSGHFFKLEWTPHRLGRGFNPAFLPVQACQFLQEHKVTGRVLTTFGSGGYVHWATRLQVSIYGIAEVVGPDFYEQYIASKSPEAFPRYLAEWQPTIAVVPFGEAPFWLYHLNSRPEWRLVNYDDTFALFLHESMPGPPACPAPKPGVDYRAYSPDEIQGVLQDAAGRKTSAFRQWLRGSDSIPQVQIRKCGFYLHTGKLQACVSEGIQGLQSSKLMVPELFLILGHAFDGLRDYGLSDYCFQIFLRAVPDAPERADIEMAVQSRRGQPLIR